MPLQSIIGIDKRNPLFTVYKETGKNEIHIYYGGLLHEVIEDKKDNPELKLMLARLYNAGVKVKSLIENFGYSYPTIKRWGDALKSGDSEQLYQALSGQGAQKKLTPEIISFAIHDSGHIYPQNKYSYSKQIRDDIKKVYKVSLSSESLRPLLQDLKIAYHQRGKLEEEEKKSIYKAYLHRRGH
jgi:transposase